MKGSRSLLFPLKTNRSDSKKIPVLNENKKIPVLSVKEKAAMLAGDNIIFRDSYIYDSSRATRHIDAQAALHMLYQIGADLINSGKAYSTTAEVNSSISSPDKKNPKRCSGKSESEQKIFDLLMQRYYSQPHYSNVNGSHTANNPFQALFVIRVALDHLAPESIYVLYTSLKIHLNRMTMYPNVVKFPNGSEFLGDYAILQILRGYIVQHQHLHFNFLSKLEKQAVVDPSDIVTASYSCIATHDMDATVNKILGESVLRVENEYSLRNTW